MIGYNFIRYGFYFFLSSVMGAILLHDNYIVAVGGVIYIVVCMIILLFSINDIKLSKFIPPTIDKFKLFNKIEDEMVKYHKKEHIFPTKLIIGYKSYPNIVGDVGVKELIWFNGEYNKLMNMRILIDYKNVKGWRVQ